MIQLQLMTPREVLLESIAAFARATLVGVALIFLVGIPILYIGLADLLSGVLYTVWPVRVGVGEILAGLNFGVLMTPLAPITFRLVTFLQRWLRLPSP